MAAIRGRSYYGHPQLKLQTTFRDAVKQSGYNNTQLAERSGLSRQHVSKLLNGRVRGTLDTWEVLLDAAGVAIGWRLKSLSETRQAEGAKV